MAYRPGGRRVGQGVMVALSGAHHPILALPMRPRCCDRNPLSHPQPARVRHRVPSGGSRRPYGLGEDGGEVGGAVCVGVGVGLAVKVLVGLGPGGDLPDGDGDGDGEGDGEGAIFEYLPSHGRHSGMIAGTAKSGM